MRRLTSLQGPERRAYAEAWVGLLVARVATASRVGRMWLLDRETRASATRRPGPVPAERLAELLRLASIEHVFAFPCLPRGLALSHLLRRHGHDAGLRMGVRRTKAGVEGHAWVECGGRPVGGDRLFVASFERLHLGYDGRTRRHHERAA